MFSWYKYLIVSLFFSHLGFWSGSLFLIAPFPDLCLLVLFFLIGQAVSERKKIFENVEEGTEARTDRRRFEYLAEAVLTCTHNPGFEQK